MEKFAIFRTTMLLRSGRQTGQILCRVSFSKEHINHYLCCPTSLSQRSDTVSIYVNKQQPMNAALRCNWATVTHTRFSFNRLNPFVTFKETFLTPVWYLDTKKLIFMRQLIFWTTVCPVTCLAEFLFLTLPASQIASCLVRALHHWLRNAYVPILMGGLFNIRPTVMQM